MRGRRVSFAELGQNALAEALGLLKRWRQHRGFGMKRCRKWAELGGNRASGEEIQGEYGKRAGNRVDLGRKRAGSREKTRRKQVGKELTGRSNG
eukprot:1432554-Rhodomonas_salina.1